MKKPTIFSIYAEDKKGLIGQLLIHFNKKGYPVHSLNAARTDISDLVLITLETELPESELEPFTHRLRKIIEVQAIRTSTQALKKTGFYRLAIAALTSELWSLASRYGAQLSNMDEHTFTLSKTGTDPDLCDLYQKLEGPHLIAFCKSGMIAEESLVSFEEIEML